MNDNDPCPPGPHTHPVAGWLWFRGVAIGMDNTIVAFVPATEHHLANRICQLLERHGICDIPDTIATLTWPAPDPADRIIDHIPTGWPPPSGRKDMP